MKRFVAIIEKNLNTGLYVGYVPGIPDTRVQAQTISELQDSLSNVVKRLLENNNLTTEAEFVGILTIRIPHANCSDRCCCNMSDDPCNCKHIKR